MLQTDSSPVEDLAVRAIARAYGLGDFHPDEEVQSNVTTAWGVDWDAPMIARDLLQNFFDANRTEIDKVKVTVKEDSVYVSAPSEFPLENLFYLGSRKGDADIGQYGEGFKVAAMCLLRDHKVTPVIVSGDRMVHITVSDEPIPVLGYHCLVYRYFTLDRPFAGTLLALPACSPSIIQAMQGGMDNFFHTRNPLLGAKLWRAYDSKFEIYASTTEEGHIFYTNLKRGEIPNLPIVLVIHKAYSNIESKIKNDRDRKAFGETLLDLFYKVYTERGIDRDSRAISAILTLARPLWETGRGHRLLWKIADSLRGNPPKEFMTLFGDRFYAESTETQSVGEHVRRVQVEEVWKAEGRKLLPGYFVKFGVPSAQTYLQQLELAAKLESQKRQSRSETPAEFESLKILRASITDLAPTIGVLIANKKCTYTVAESDVVMGELIKGRGYHSLEVFLNADSFESDFGDALALFLHEHAHPFGIDGSRAFSDALTGLLATIVRRRDQLDKYEEEWNTARAKVRSERANSSGVIDEFAELEQMDQVTLRTLLRDVPPVELRHALRRFKSPEKQ